MRRTFGQFLALAALLPAFAAVQPNRGAGAPVRSVRPPAEATIVIETGELGGAKFTLARPTRWNRNVLLLAHGLRPEDRPLVADLTPDRLAYKTLLDEGWLIAKTSFRRNGIIVADAISDLDALRSHIAEKHGALDRVLLEGEAMGGLIVALIAERESELDETGRAKYSGAIAIGAALQVREPNSALGLSLQPRIPLLFLTNQSEIEGPRNYVTAKVLRPAPLRPELLRIARDGHVNVNQYERLAALRTLNAWLDHGRAALPRPVEGALFPDATVVAPPRPSQVTPHPDGRGFDARVVEVSALFGNVLLNAQPADFATAGMARMTWCQLTIRDATHRVLHGRDFESVKRGEWVVFSNADGFSWLARNRADAAATGRLAVGDTVSLRRYDEK